MKQRLFWLLQLCSLVSPFHVPTFVRRYLHLPSVASPGSSRTRELTTPSEQTVEESVVAKKHITGHIGLYIHIPYCRQRCRYCDFAIVPIGPHIAAVDTDSRNNNDDDPRMRAFRQLDQRYLEAVLEELSWIQNSKKLQNGKDEKILLSSVYFGGGTPSLAPIRTLRRILQAVRDPDGPFELAKDAEISIEMDPGTFTLQKAKSLKALGINRISLGVQSFDDQILALLGRTHRRKDIDEALKILKAAFGTKLNYSVDLISALPGLTCAKWVETLETATHLKPPPKHLSLYDLQIEKGTVFGIWYDPEKKTPYRQTKGNSPVQIMRLPSEDEAAFMYKYASGYLHSKGFEHYEVSSYALKRDSTARSRHNQIYWGTDSEWYAVGLGSTSYVNETLVARPRALADYLEWVKNRHENGEDSNDQQETIDEADLLMDVVLKRLRTSEGLSLPWIRRNFKKGEAYVKAVLEGAQLGIDLGLATMDSKGQLRLTDPDGFLYSNTIISTIFVELERIEGFTRND